MITCIEGQQGFLAYSITLWSLHFTSHVFHIAVSVHGAWKSAYYTSYVRVTCGRSNGIYTIYWVLYVAKHRLWLCKVELWRSLWLRASWQWRGSQQKWNEWRLHDKVGESVVFSGEMLSRVPEISVAPIASKMNSFLLSKEDDNDGAKSGHCKPDRYWSNWVWQHPAPIQTAHQSQLRTKTELLLKMLSQYVQAVK